MSNAGRIKAFAGDRFTPTAKLEITTAVSDVSEGHRELLAHFMAHYIDKAVPTEIRLFGDFFSAQQEELISDVSIRAAKYRKNF